MAMRRPRIVDLRGVAIPSIETQKGRGQGSGGRDQFSGAKCLLGEVRYIGQKAAWKVANDVKWLLAWLRFFET
jgi:hypothetical protein